MRQTYQICIAAALAILLLAVMALLFVSEEPETPDYIEVPPLPTPVLQIIRTAAPEEEAAEEPAITPPAISAASGSDIILRPVAPSSDTDLTPVGTDQQEEPSAP